MDMDMSDSSDVEFEDDLVIPGLGLNIPTARDAYTKVSREMGRVFFAVNEALTKDYRAAWVADAERLKSCKMSPHKFAIIGRTGVGKSTLVNAILRDSVVSSSAYAACTSVVTEIKYADTSEYIAKIRFMSSEEFKKELQDFYNDLATPLDDSIRDTSSTSPDSIAEARIFEMLPALRTVPIETWDINNIVGSAFALLQQVDTVISSPTPLELQNKLRTYLTSNATLPNISMLWPLVKSVSIAGRFDVLSTGASLVDLPGYGDINKARHSVAGEYLKSADCVLLVADIKRATHDIDNYRYLHKILKQLVADGRVVESSEASVTLVITGSDIPIGDNELYAVELPEIHQSRLSELKKAMSDDSQKLQEYQERQTRLAGILMSRKEANYINKEKIIHQRITSLRGKQYENNLEKNMILANVRQELIQNSIQELCCKIYKELYQGADIKPPIIPAYCVGSRDYLTLANANVMSGQPAVFRQEVDTQIPGLQARIRTLGEKRSLAEASSVVSDAISTLKQTRSYFEEFVAEDKQLSAYEEFVSMYLHKFLSITRKEVKQATKALRQNFHDLETELNDKVSEADRKSISVIKALESYKWNTYAAIMRRNGEWRDISVHENLTRDLESILPRWATIFNQTFPRLLVELEAVLVENAKLVIMEIYQCTQVPPAILKRIEDDDLIINAEKTIRRACDQCRRDMFKVNRENNQSFASMIREEMQVHYREVGAIKGHGMFARMKEKNMTYIQMNHGKLFASIPLQTKEIFDQACYNLSVRLQKSLQNVYERIKDSSTRPTKGPQSENNMLHRARNRVKVRDFLQESLPSLEELHLSIQSRLDEISKIP